jgi:hypothetical protein
MVGHVETRRFDANLLRDCLQEPLLGEWPVVGDVVRLTYRALTLQRQNEPLYHIGHIH